MELQAVYVGIIREREYMSEDSYGYIELENLSEDVIENLKLNFGKEEKVVDVKVEHGYDNVYHIEKSYASGFGRITNYYTCKVVIGLKVGNELYKLKSFEEVKLKKYFE